MRQRKPQHHGAVILLGAKNPEVRIKWIYHCGRPIPSHSLLQHRRIAPIETALGSGTWYANILHCVSLLTVDLDWPGKFRFVQVQRQRRQLVGAGLS
jgi:hypothetical protein